MAWWDNPFLSGQDRFGNRSPFWGGRNPTSGDYQDWYNTPEVRDDPENPSAPYGEWERFLGAQRMGGGFSNQDQWSRSLFNRAQSGFDSAQLSNPGLTLRNYLNRLDPNLLQKTWAGLTPQQQGVFGPGLTRTVRWG